MDAKKKQKDLKKSKRTRIWSTIVELIVMIVMLVLLTDLYAFAFQLIVAVPQIEQSSKAMDEIVQALDSGGAEDGDLGRLLAGLEHAKAENVYIYDRGGKTLYKGGVLVPPSRREINYYEVFRFFLGESLGDYGIYDGELLEKELDNYFGDQTVDKLVTDANKELSLSAFSNSEMAMNRWWLRASAADGEYTVYLERLCLMDYKDKLMLVLGGVFVGLMFLFPFLTFLTSSIRGIVAQNRLKALYYQDPVTLGKNWQFFKDRAPVIIRRRRKNSIWKRIWRMIVQRHKQGEDRCVIVCLHVDKYRNYCTCYGAAEGERLIERMHQILLGQMRSGKELFARYSDAEFGLLLWDIPGEPFEERLNALMSMLSGAAQGRTIHFGAGICVVTDWNTDVEECYVCAGMARATIAEDSTQRIVWFNEQMKQERVWERHVEDTMEQALKNHEFQVYVQPKYDPVTEELSGGEALIRWISPQDGFIGPGKFIPIFEKNGFITRIDDFMVSHVAELQAGWIAEGRKVVPISVNLSRAHFADPGLPEHICRMVDEHKVPHELIELEITESVFFDDKAALLAAIDRLHNMGFEISMDDFGSGYSSLNSLKDLSLDVLKLDGEFFRGKQEDGRGDIVVEEAIKLAKRLNMRIVAEGVEHKEQVDFLADQGCDMIQGFYFAKPMPSAEFAERLQ